MSLFSKEKSLKFKLIPSTPEQTQARGYLTNMMQTNYQYPTEQIADLTGTEQQIQDSLPSYLSQLDEDYEASQGYYTDVLNGGYDPRTSDFYQGLRAEQGRLKSEAQGDVARRAQKAGMGRSTPALGIQADVGNTYDAQTLQQLGLLTENERTRRAGAAEALPRLSAQRLSSVAGVEQLAAVARQQEQARLSAMYQAVVNTMLAQYNINANIAMQLLKEPRYAGYQTGGGLTDLGFLMSVGSDYAKAAAMGGSGGGGSGMPPQASVWQ